MDRRNFRLGPAILKTADSSEHAPDPWRTALLTEHLTSTDAPALAQTNKPALHWLLAEWPAATLTVPIRPASAEEPEELLRRAQSAKEQIALRGGQATTLVLKEQGYIREDEAWWHVVFAALASRSKVLPSFTLSLQLQHQPAELFAFVRKAFPGLTSLVIGTPSDGSNTVQLPPPTAFPALKHLTIHRVSVDWRADFWALVAPYLAKLESLTIHEQPDYDMASDAAEDDDSEPPVYTTIFSSTTTAHKLVRLALPCRLEPWLAGLLQRHAPALQELTVRGVSTGGQDEEEIQEDVTAVCSWHNVRCTEGGIEGDDLEWLPLPAQGKLTIELQGEGAALELTLPVSDAEAQKLASIDVKGCDRVQINAGHHPARTHAAALRAALPHVAPLQAAGVAELQLCQLALSAAVTAAVGAAAAAGWPRLSLQGFKVPQRVAINATLPALHTLELNTSLDDELLAQLLRCCSAVGTLAVRAVQLQSPLPAGAALPWQTVRLTSVKELGLEDWLEQVQLLGDTAWEVRRLEICLSMDQVNSGETQQLAEQLRTGPLTTLTTLQITWHNDTPDTHNPRVLRAALALANSLPCQPQNIQLHDWASTHPLIAELRHLPAWSSTLAFYITSMAEPSGPGSAWPMARAPWLIPASYRTWRVELEGDGLTEAEVTAFVMNAPSNRSQARPLKIEIEHGDGEESEAVEFAVGLQCRLDEYGTYPCVTVTHCEDDEDE